MVKKVRTGRLGCNPSNLEALLGRYRVGDTATVHAFRRDELMTFEVSLQGDRAPGIALALAASGKAATQGLLRPSAK